MEWAAGLAGLLSALVLAWPMIEDTKHRRHWDRLREARARTDDEKAAEDLKAVRDQFLDERLGNFARHQRITMAGLAILAAAFLMLFLSGLGGK
jgi:hypothetical protein